MQLLIGTQNPGKLREYRQMLAALPFTVVSPEEVGLGALNVEETGTTFAENAELKAMAYAQSAKSYALADDSGLEVDALGGAPGVYSARYGGAGLDDRGRRLKLLEELRDVPADQRRARFVCVIVVVHPQTLSPVLVRGTCEGQITFEERDNGKGYGFGYDPIFMPDGYEQTFGEIPTEIKHTISHRGRALAQLVPMLARLAADAKS